MKGMKSAWMYSGYNSSHGVSHTWEWRIDPQFTVAQVIPYEISGGGLHKVGIVGYRRRPNPRGQEQVVDYSGDGWGAWTGYEYIRECTAVTFGAVAGARQEISATCNLFFW